MVNLTRIYTRTGDDGTTALGDLSRTSKTDLRLAAYADAAVWSGDPKVKIFKDTGAVSARLMTDVDLQPGTYVLEVPFFADVFESISNGQKFAPSDPNSGEAMLFAGNTGTGWIANTYNTRNVLKHTFTLDTAQRITVGAGFRGRYAIQNNGWFVDNVSLRRWQ